MFDDANNDLWNQAEEETEKRKIKDNDCQSTPSTPNVGKVRYERNEKMFRFRKLIYLHFTVDGSRHENWYRTSVKNGR